MQLANRALNYLAVTKHYAIEFDAQVSSPNTIFCPSSDASYGDDPNTRRSTQGYIFSLFNGPIDWKATKRRTVTTSTTEAELLASFQAVIRSDYQFHNLIYRKFYKYIIIKELFEYKEFYYRNTYITEEGIRGFKGRR